MAFGFWDTRPIDNSKQAKQSGLNKSSFKWLFDKRSYLAAANMSILYMHDQMI
jgi:hypothetical protein